MAGVMKVAYTSLKQFSGLCESSINMKEVIFWPTSWDASRCSFIASISQRCRPGQIGSLYYPCNVTDQLTRPSSLKKLDENNFSKHKPGYFFGFCPKESRPLPKNLKPTFSRKLKFIKATDFAKKNLKDFFRFWENSSRLLALKVASWKIG